MSRKMMYFGTKERMDWVPCPAVDRPASMQSPNGTLEYENGGAFVRRVPTGHRNYEMAWNFLPNEEAEKIEGWAQGVWGSGPYYWVDPMIARGNMLPSYWAYPGAGVDSTPLIEGKAPQDVTIASVPVPNPVPGAPTRGIRYQVSNDPGVQYKTLFLPIPPGHTLTFTSHSVRNGADVYVQTYPAAGGDPSNLRAVQYQDSYNAHFETFRGDVVRGIELSVRRNPAQAPGQDGSIELYSMSARLQQGLTSQPDLPQPARNRVPNPIARAGSWQASFGGAGSDGTAEFRIMDGRDVIRMDWTAAPSSGTVGVLISTTSALRVVVEPGETVKFGAYVAASVPVRFSVNWHSETGGYITATAGDYHQPSQLSLIEWETTVPEGARQANIRILSMWGNVEVDDWIIAGAAFVGDRYGDGDTPGWEWEGEPNNSESYDTATPPQISTWTPGLGHSGCEFVQFPERVDYSAAMNKVGITAELKEVGTWL